MSEIKLTMKADGSLAIPDLDDLRQKLADTLRSGILASLPDEFFDAQVDACFRRLTEPRQVGTTGDERCNECINGDYRKRRAVCPHITKEAPSEIQEMILGQMRERVKEAVDEFTKRWATGGITDHDIVDRLERIVNASAESYMKRVGQEIVAHALEALRSDFNVCQNHDSGTGRVCGAQVLRGTACSRCGMWA